MTLGELIALLEMRPQEQEIRYDFGYLVPTTLDSWRGRYEELALGYEYSRCDWPKVKDILADCKAAVGKTYEGFKGGDFQMYDSTDVHVDNEGDSSGTKIVVVSGDIDYTIIYTAR